AMVLFGAANLTAQDRQNVVVFEVTEPGLGALDGPSIYDAIFKSTSGATLIVEPYSVPGLAGPLSRFNVHGLKGEDVIVSAPGHEQKIVRTSGQTFVDVWLYKTGQYTRPVSSRYWYGPGVSSLNAATATLFGDSSNLYFASTVDLTGRIAIGRVDRAPVLTQE